MVLTASVALWCMAVETLPVPDQYPRRRRGSGSSRDDAVQRVRQPSASSLRKPALNEEGTNNKQFQKKYSNHSEKSPTLQVEDERDGNSEVNVYAKGMGGAEMCAPLAVTGLEQCPSWEGTDIMSTLLTAKKQMLKGVVRVMTDPTSCGEGGDPEKPLLLVQQLAVDEADAVTGAALPLYIGKASDAGSWSPEPGGMNRWLERYHRDVLKRTRPVIVYVHVRRGSSVRVGLLSSAVLC